ncbi:glycosyltransferase family 4 protein [Flavobacterium sandaracinum]|uniref:Glycosyltransferase n=1 Tax=Flavobacterium sandaracinum TaxID=2541733 RepID=A0A4R5CW45_9FLAO|nr:glycosyltransferase family 4 protein [Flavobacterium sandaracinum]TDE02033.1 glycosyltransferase [Flavobacterium sandaracinum]
MKTILIAHNYSEISFSAMSYHLAQHLANLGNEVVFISHDPYFADKMSVIKKQGKITICSWPTKKRPTSLRDFFWYAKIHLHYKPDIIIGHFVGSNITVSVSKFLSLGKVKTYEYYHTLSAQLMADQKKTSIKQKVLFIRKKIFYKLLCDVIICPSELAKADLKSFYGLNKGFVLLNPMIDRFKNKIISTEESILISYLGRLDQSKGVLDLIEAYLRYKEKVKYSKIILNIAGTGSQEIKIKELVKSNMGVHYFGGLNYDQIDAYLINSHFAIIPSKFDNLPTVGLEAMMNQTPLLISNTTGLTHYLNDGVECFKFDATIDEMVSLFAKVEDNFNSYQQMSIAARSTFLNTFSMDMYCKNFAEIIL